MPEERRSRWQDDRVDDLATLVRDNATRLDALQNLVAVHDIQMIEVKRDQAAREATRDDHRFQIQLMMLTVMLTSIGSLIVSVILLLTHHP